MSAALLMAAAPHTRPNRRMHRTETPRARRRPLPGVDVPVSGSPSAHAVARTMLDKPIWVVWCGSETGYWTYGLSQLLIFEISKVGCSEIRPKCLRMTTG